MTNRVKINFILNTIFYSTVIVLLYLAGRFLLAYLFPVIIGIIVTVLVQRPARVISSRIRIKKGYCALVLVLLSYAAIISLAIIGLYKGGIYLTEVFGSNSEIFKKLSDTFSEFGNSLNSYAERLPEGMRSLISGIFEKVSEGIGGYISGLAKSTATYFPMFFTGTIVTIVASCYIARDFDGFRESLKSVLSERIMLAYRMTAELFKENVLKIILGYLKLLVITFIELLLGLLILRIDHAIMLALLIAFLDMLPIIGTGTVLIPWGIFEIVNNNIYIGAGLIILYLFITIIRNVVEPKIIGKQIGLHPLIALISVFIGLKLMGFIGIFILPLTVMLLYKMYDKGVFEILLSNKKNGG